MALPARPQTDDVAVPGQRAAMASLSIAVPAIAPTDADKAGAGLRFFFGFLVEHWRLTVHEQMALLGIKARSSFYVLRAHALAGGAVQTEPVVHERLSHLMGIAHALASIFQLSPDAADAWTRTPNSDALFGGAPPLVRLIRGGVSDLYIVRRYLLNRLI